MSELGIWLVRPEAEPLGQRLAAALGGELYRPWQTPEANARLQFHAVWRARRQWLLVMASGIAVRYLDGLPQSKLSDPAVVVLDEAARFAIALLSGHEGGANALAYAVARASGAQPVITTASEALKPLTLGIGCRRGKDTEAIELAVRAALGHRPLSAVREVATIDLKADEPGLLAFCARHNLPLRVIAQTDVAARGWTDKPSAWVRHNVGVDGVCEPCALIASPRGRLIIPKTARDGVTVAVVEDSIEQEHTQA
ncbi:MAG: cobalamin biosynthesis protein [Paludibacterium sp.]|uniref:cobalamin biosynthesis protein n=1 Tax=Paludibacterium sp. TaxID=1917523 RepID=UPI0025D24580|nr:cobalamin biosynthesis protein [Paludibacterium sp.]MBV8046994.1 cobalamin biosynthesis protein [Paludibacterium sp.]MBV8649066.1 cobalamin biosynthesis protein [Paludibacterium sp.]